MEIAVEKVPDSKVHASEALQPLHMHLPDLELSLEAQGGDVLSCQVTQRAPGELDWKSGDHTAHRPSELLRVPTVPAFRTLPTLAQSGGWMF